MSKGIYIGVHQEAKNTTINTVLKPEHVGTYVSLTNLGSYGFTQASDGTLTSNNKGVASSKARTMVNFSKLATEAGYDYDEKFTLKIEWAVSSESNYDIFYIVDNTTGKEYVNASGTTNGTLNLTIYPSDILAIRYYKDDSGNSGNDQATFKMTLSGGGVNLPAGDYARRVVSMYIGVDGLARRVKKGYIGVNNIARMFYATPGLYRIGSIVPLSPIRHGNIADSIGNYAVFSGGDSMKVEGTYWDSKVTEYYNTSLTKTTATSLTYQVSYHSSAHNSSYLFIGGGWNTTADEDETTTYRSTMNKYNTSMTKSTATALSSVKARMLTGTTSNNTYAIFAGGNAPSSGTPLSVNYYNTSATRSTGTALTLKQSQSQGTNAGNYCIFAGGTNSEYSNNPAVNMVFAYNNSMSRTTCTSLSPGREYIASASAGNGQYAIFYGGSYNKREVTTVDCYNSSLTKINIPKATIARTKCGSATLPNGWAVFLGGEDADYNQPTIVEGYDASLTKTRAEQMLYGRTTYYQSSNCCAKAGNSYLVLAGGGFDVDLNRPNTAEAYQIIA